MLTEKLIGALVVIVLFWVVFRMDPADKKI